MRIYSLIFTLVVLVSGCSERTLRQGGSSAMSPTIQPHQTIVVDMSAYHKEGPQRWDVVVFHPPPATRTQPQEIWVKRVIGLPGESLEIRDDGVYIDGKRQLQPERLAGIHYLGGLPGWEGPTVSYPYKVSTDAYFLVGDNTTNSWDSRSWGALPRQSILGRVKNK
jgi:signal peptidase I